jgi:hypothetical protein
MVCRTNRLFLAGVCLVAVVCAVQAAEPQASKDKAAASPARLGKALTSEHAKAAPQAATRTVTAAAVKPAAYRGSESFPCDAAMHCASTAIIHIVIGTLDHQNLISIIIAASHRHGCRQHVFHATDKPPPSQAADHACPHTRRASVNNAFVV